MPTPEEPLLELSDLAIDDSVSPVFSLGKMLELRAFVIRLEPPCVHVAIAIDLERVMRGKDFVGFPSVFQSAIEFARFCTNRQEVVSYQISNAAFDAFVSGYVQSVVRAVRSG